MIFENPGPVLAADMTRLTLDPLADFPRPRGLVTITVYHMAKGG